VQLAAPIEKEEESSSREEATLDPKSNLQPIYGERIAPMTTQPLVTDELATALRATIGKLTSASDEEATPVFTSETRLLHNVLTEARIRQFTLQVDEPPLLGGTDQAPNPVELVLAALGTCQEIVYAAYAAVLGIELEDVEITVSGPLDLRGLFGITSAANGFQHVTMETRIRSREAPDRVQQLVDTVQKHCPVLDIIQRPLEVHNQVELNGTPLS